MKAQDLQHSGDLYLPNDPDIAKAQLAAQELQYDFNQTRPSEGKKRQELLQKMFAEIGEHPCTPTSGLSLPTLATTFTLITT